jgi:hypothetical protein
MILEKITNLIYHFGKRLTSIQRNIYENLDNRELYLKSFPEPKTSLERSYFQYLCQYNEYSGARLLLNLFCIPVFFLISAKILYDCLLIKNRCSRSFEPEECIAVLDADEEIIPEVLIKKHGSPAYFSLRGVIFFDKQVLSIYCQAIMKYWYEPHFIIKIILRLGRYAELIMKTQCKIIIASAEYSFASSVLTDFCEKKSIKHINVMHGEKVINPVDAFCSFHEFIVWDKHYISVFTTLRAKVEEYTIAKPQMLNEIIFNENQQIKYDFTYYLGWELTLADSINIKKSMEVLVRNGYRVCVRMHPRYGERAKIEEIFDGFQIEFPNEVSMIESLESTHAVIGLLTTVFWHAEEFGRPIIIDDVSNPDFHKKLFDIRYLWIFKPHSRLSLFQLTQHESTLTKLHNYANI